MDWIRYANKGATRSQPLSPQLARSLSFLGDMGVQAEVFSGGQPAAGRGPRVGSTRHDHGNAADVFFYQNGRRLDWSNPDDLPVFQEIVRRGRENGLTGFGAGDGYMQPGSMHIGFGNEAVWGANGQGENAPDWLRAAYYGAQPGQNGETTMATRNAPQGRQQPGAQGPQGGEQRPESIWDRMGILTNQDRRHRLAMALEGMTLNPNQGLIRGLEAGIQNRREDRQQQQAQAQVQQRRNATAEFLRTNGSEDLAALIDNGVPADRVFSLYRAQGQAANDPSVQSSEVLPDASGSVLTMRDGSMKVVTAGGETLMGQDAMDFVRNAQEAYTQQQRDIYGARREGTLGADVLLGGEAARVGEEGKDIADMARSNLEAAGQIGSNIGNIDTAIDALRRGADAGSVYNRLPRLDEASASLQNAMDRMGLDVIGSVTFGALSGPELRLAMETAVPRNLNSQELQKWLERRRDAQAKARAGLLEAAEYFSNGGDLAGWVERVKGMQGGGGSGETSQGASGGTAAPDEPDMSRDGLDLSPEAKRYLGVE